jgi:phosphoribosylaminoimidazole carboxylase PurE protein
MKRIVPIIMGSKRDYEFAKGIGDVLGRLGIPIEYRVGSAHKVPEHVLEMVGRYDQENDLVVYETVAGRSNALSGMVAGKTDNSVIACVPDNDKDALQMDIWSNLRMPSGISPVVVLGAENGALAAARIISLYDDSIKELFSEYMDDVRKKVMDADEELRS